MITSEFLNSRHNEDPAEGRCDMFLRPAGNGTIFRHELGGHSTQRVEWVSLETDENGKPVAVRESCERTEVGSKNQAFYMAGKEYRNLKAFLKSQDEEWGVDSYGRQVLCTKERYPCFDSYDFLSENRYFRWFFIREGNSVSQLFYADDRDKIYITEDVHNIEDWAWSRMKATGFCQPQKGTKK